MVEMDIFNALAIFFQPSFDAHQNYSLILFVVMGD